MTDEERIQLLEDRATQVAELVSRGFATMTDILEGHSRRIAELEDRVRELEAS